VSPTAVCAEMFYNVMLCPPLSWGYGKGIQGIRLYPPGFDHENWEIWRVSARQFVVRWTPETGQVAKRESSLGAAGRPKVRHDQYSEETQS
jgi:hypothetical protein